MASKKERELARATADGGNARSLFEALVGAKSPVQALAECVRATVGPWMADAARILNADTANSIPTEERVQALVKVANVCIEEVCKELKDALGAAPLLAAVGEEALRRIEFPKHHVVAAAHTTKAVGTLKASDEPSKRAPPAFALANLVAKGTVVPDEASGPYQMDTYHRNIVGRSRGYFNEAGLDEWLERNKAATAELKSWSDIDPERVDPDYLLVYGSIGGKGVKMQQLRPRIIKAQRAMCATYGRAYKKARAKRGAAADFAILEAMPGKPGKVAQGGGTELSILDLYKGALEAISELWRYGTEVVAASGEADVELSWGIKKAQRIWFKLSTKYDGDVSRVTDCARISIVFRSAAAMARAATFVLERAATFKNRVQEPTPEGYRDLMFTVAMQNGHVCEVQLHLAEMMAAKHSGAGHRMYKMCRRVLRNPIVEQDTYCREVVEGEPQGEGAHNAQGEREGQGTMVYADGLMYVGQWKAGLKEGRGTLYYATGNRYEGEWKADRREGQGTMYFATGDRYEGEWKAGKMEGRATYYYAAGDRYEGEWKAGKKEGRGTYYFADGRKEVGRYAGDRDVGEAARWSADGKTAWRVQDGECGAAISLEEAAAIAARVGLPVP